MTPTTITDRFCIAALIAGSLSVGHAAADVRVGGTFPITDQVEVILRELDNGSVVQEVSQVLTVSGTGETTAELTSEPSPGNTPDVLEVVVESFGLDVDGSVMITIDDIDLTLADFGMRFGDGVGVPGTTPAENFFPFFGGAFFVQEKNFGEYVGSLTVDDGVNPVTFQLPDFGLIDFDVPAEYLLVNNGGTIEQQLTIFPFVFAEFEFQGRAFQFEMLTPDEFQLVLVSTAPIVVLPDCPADLDQNGLLNVDDVQVFVDFFLGGNFAVDFDNNGLLNVDDVQLFVTFFLGGCG